MRTIKIEGNSTIYVKSDSMELNLELIYEDPSYQIANDALRRDHLALIRILNELNFESGKLKTTSNRIQVLQSYDDKPKRFKVSQNFVYRDKLDMENLSKLLDKIKVDDSLNFNVVYYSSKMKTYEEDALVFALKDARKKAEVVAKAAKVDLDQLVSFEEVNQHGPSLLRLASAETMPDDLQLSKSVSVVYSIK